MPTAHRGMVCARSPTCVRTRRMTAEDKARERGASVEYAEAVRKVMPVPRAPAPVEAVELVGWDSAALADYMGVCATVRGWELAAADGS